MELHDTPILRYLGQLNQPEAVPACGTTHWFLQHRDSGWPLPPEQTAQPLNRLTAEPLR